MLYCHTPDTMTPVEETAVALHDHFSKGHCKKVRMANFWSIYERLAYPIIPLDRSKNSYPSATKTAG